MIGAVSVIIASIIAGIFGLFQGWYSFRGVNNPSQKEAFHTLEKSMMTGVSTKPEAKIGKILYNGKQNIDSKVKIKIGDKVLSMWKGRGNLYHGEVREIKDSKYRIFYDFSDEEWVEKKHIYFHSKPKESELSLDNTVFVLLDSSGQKEWFPAIIKNIRNNTYYVTYDSGEKHAWVTVERIILK